MDDRAYHGRGEHADLSIVRESEEGTSSNQEVTSSSVTESVARTRTRDEKNVTRSRTLLMIVLLAVALTIAGLVYSNLSRNEHQDFVAQFESSAKQISHMTHNKIKNAYLSIESMSILFPSAAHHSGETLPFLTVPDFEASGESARLISHASLIAFAPLLETKKQLEQWNAYSSNHTNWIEEGRSIDSVIVELQEGREKARGANDSDELEHVDSDQSSSIVTKFVYKVDDKGQAIKESDDGLFAPLWEMTPVPNDTSAINFNLASNELFAELLIYANVSKTPILSRPLPAEDLFRNLVPDTSDGPVSLLVQPVFDGFEHGKEHRVVGVVAAVIPWVDFFTDVASEDQRDMVVVADSCGINNTFVIHGAKAEYMGNGDRHDNKFSSMEHRSVFVEFDSSNEIEHCHHILHIFASAELKAGYETSKPIQYAAFIVAMFLATGIMFLIYDWFVGARQAHTELKADKANAIVSELFPKEIAHQLFDEKAKDTEEGAPFTAGRGLFDGSDLANTSTIARLYPAATILFADIAGFTAWSSMRGPDQVFLLLETVFRAFDMLAKKHGIYKVETVGDCYVAVCGVPKPKPDHAVQMLRFARAAQFKFQDLVKGTLEMRLGPDTGDLGMRVGIHSGPVTAGVLRADRARFQLFGDTVNTASRMESTGQKGRVHLSEQTAAELAKYGKKEWCIPRDDVVSVKGKGQLKTFWFKQMVETSGSAYASSMSGTSESNDSEAHETRLPVLHKAIVISKNAQTSHVNVKMQRIVDWNSELLLQLLEPVVARRQALSRRASNGSTTADLTLAARQMGKGKMIVDEVAEIIEMPSFARVEATTQLSLDTEVVQQLHEYVADIASMYNDNPFHNFEHASHVAMSVHKLLGRIVAPQVDDQECSRGNNPRTRDEDLHDHTYGIKSDPLTHFSVVLAALIHDVDHPGVANAQLIKEQPTLGKRYQGRSVAEQHSVALAWDALLAPKYNQLRAALFATKGELYRFRQLLVNSVIATDIFDKDLSAMRKKRWCKAFDAASDAATEITNETSRKNQDRKATIVIEHLIQASDIAHTMQHWHVYLKWNQRLFNEMLRAYRDGRSDKDPSDGWVDGELWFFDNYIIPLANKLKECGVFGVSSDECLTYALQNRSEWAAKGLATVGRYIAEYDKPAPTL